MRRDQLLERRAVRRSRPGYAAARAVGGGLGALLVVGSAVSVVPTTLQQDGHRELALPGGLTRLTVDAPRGDVVVETGGATVPVVRAQTEWTFTEPTVEVEEGPDGEARVAATCSGPNWGSCRADLEVLVPPGTAVDVTTTFGDVDVTGTGSVEARATAGDVLVQGRPTEVAARTTFGDVHLNAVQAPSAVTVTSTYGDVQVQLPGTSRYAVTASTTFGERRVDLPADPASPHTVNLRTTFGSIEASAQD